MAVAKVFKSGNSQAVRLPKALRVQGSEVEIVRRGDEIVMREIKKDRPGLAEAFELLAALPEDAVEDIKDRRPLQERKGL